MKTAVQIWRFHLFQFYWRQPVAAVVTGVSLLAMLASLIVWTFMLGARRDVAQDLNAIALSRQTNSAAPAVPVATRQTIPDLPAFSSSALTADFHAIAADVKLPVDEVSYSLDSSANQPYLRYRVTLVVKTGYPEMRRFAAALVSALPNVSLDSVRCGKDDAAAVPLSCQLAFSAFYRKGGNG